MKDSLFISDVSKGEDGSLGCFVSVTSLPSMKSRGHWSESASHWLFLYVKPFNVALQRYHETYFTSWLFPPAGISSRLRELPRCTHVPSFGILAKLGNNPPLPFAKTSWQEPCKYQPYCCFLCCWCFFDLCRSSKLSFYVRGRGQQPDKAPRA